MKSNNNLIYLTYILLLSAIAFFSISSVIEKKNFYLKKNVLIQDDNLGKLLIEFSIGSEDTYVGITQKLGFYIVNIHIYNKKNPEQVSESYDGVTKNILYICKNFYGEKVRESSAIYDALNDALSNRDKTGDFNNMENLEKLVKLELFLKNPDAEYNKIKSRLLDLPKIYSRKIENRNIPVIIFLVIVLFIFHFFRDKIKKSLKKL